MFGKADKKEQVVVSRVELLLSTTNLRQIKMKMKIFIKELKGNEIEVADVESNTSIALIKQEIQRKLNIPGV